MKNIIIIITFFLALSLNAQQIEKQVISSTGNDVSAGGIQISQTVGETVVETFTSGSFILGQGFQQVEEINDSTIAIEEIDIIVNYNLYPNPTNDIINVELELNANSNMNLILVNTQGQIIQNKEIEVLSGEVYKVQFSLQNYSNGIYFLKFYDTKGNVSKVLEINKF